MRKIIFLIIFFVLSSANAAEYRQDEITIIYENETDLMIALDSIDYVKDFFNKIGYECSKPIKIEFKNGGVEHPYSKTKKCYAYILFESRHIFMTAFDTDVPSFVFKQPVNQDLEMHMSCMVHELAHFFLDCQGKVDSYALHEYVAYIVQFSFISNETKNKILSENTHLENGFEKRNEITELAYEADAQKFGVNSYLHYLHDKGRLFKRIIELKENAIRSINTIT